uniref:Uncharacterized protein n=1 Tax=Arundo donax TaxID=35708 RepID=A0A0A9BSP9_ARUDO
MSSGVMKYCRCTGVNRSYRIRLCFATELPCGCTYLETRFSGFETNDGILCKL